MDHRSSHQNNEGSQSRERSGRSQGQSGQQGFRRSSRADRRCEEGSVEQEARNLGSWLERPVERFEHGRLRESAACARRDFEKKVEEKSQDEEVEWKSW